MTGMVMLTKSITGVCRGESTTRIAKNNDQDDELEEQQQENQLSIVALLIAALRKSMVSCRVDNRRDDVISVVRDIEIGWPTNVRHVTHVTFDRFNGFLGLPVEYEEEVPCRVPSASASVFGVSAESMQCCYDSRGNSVPTILLLMQERLYSQGGLKAEGIFRINPENSKEEYVRDQLNRGFVPDDIDVHCLAGLIKAWFRELPSGVLDGLSPEQVLECNTEEESVELVNLLKPTEAALLNWAVDLMADVVEEEEINKMNARNIAMVFAPNMTQMSDPLTALMHAVQVMNLFKTLIMKTLREREESGTGGFSPLSSRSSGQQTDEDFDSQLPISDFDDNHANYSQSSEGEDEAEEEEEGEILQDIEECFLRTLEETENIMTEMISEQKVGDMQIMQESPGSSSGFIEESGISLSGSKVGSVFTSTSDGEDSSGSSFIEVAQIIDTKRPLKGDVEMLDRPMELIPLPCVQ